MRSVWKPCSISKSLIKIFFKFKRNKPQNVKNKAAGTFFSQQALVRNFIIRAKRTDLILPIYKDKKIKVYRGNRFVTIFVDQKKIFSTFGRFVHTKRYSPIHKGTEFKFKQFGFKSNKFNKFFKRRGNFTKRKKVKGYLEFQRISKKRNAPGFNKHYKNKNKKS
jgi:ribosomal protein S19